MSWPVNIPKIKDGISTFSEKDLNCIFQALEDRTTFLKQQIRNESVVDGIGFSDIGMSNCHKGQFVAYDKKLQQYVPAQALWSNMAAVPADEAYVLGVLISDVIEDQGTILVSGILRGKEIITSIMGDESHIPGHYYLSGNGKVSQNLSDIAFPVHCGALTATNCFVLGIQIPDFRTHSHTKYDLQDTCWKPVTESTISIPSNATYFYDSNLDSTIATILRTFISGSALVLDNKCLIEHKDYIISDGYIWLLKDFGKPVNGTLYATNPFMGIVPWLTAMAVADGNDVIKVRQVGTTALLDLNFNKVESSKNTGKAIASISNQGISECDVINSITAGAGVSVNTVGGNALITATTNLPKVLDFNIINGNGIIIGGDDIILVKFPADRQASVNGTVRVPFNVTKATAKLFMYVDGIGSYTSQGTALVKAINIPFNTKEVVKPTTPIQLVFAPLSTPNTNMVYLWESVESFDVAAGDQLNITIAFDHPANTVSICSFGICLEYN